LAGLKNLRGVCNWTRDYKEEKEAFESSEEDVKNESDDLLKGQLSEDSLVEKEITLSSEEKEPSSEESSE
jgi:lysyl-tRNA synthetase class I